MKLRIWLLCLVLISVLVQEIFGDSAQAQRTFECPWNMAVLGNAPKTFDTEEFQADEHIKPLYYQGLPYTGRETRVFAYYGCPDVAPGMKVPAMVLVHGGAGTAFRDWVQMWVDRGYAAIAMDLNGCVPNDDPNAARNVKHHQWFGPYNRNFTDIDGPIEDQWMYHAVADVILANSLLRSFEQVDAERIGFMGISWGGIISSNVAGVDNRFAFGVIVYGCGYLFESGNHYQKTYEAMSDDDALKCRSLWDGSSYLHDSQMPLLWINNTNDSHFYMPIFQKSYWATREHARLCFIPGYGHNYAIPWGTEQIYAFADSVCKQAKPLVDIVSQSFDNQALTVSYSEENAPVEAYLYYTTDQGDWLNRTWQQTPAEIIPDRRQVTVSVPQDATAFFLNLHGDNGIVSSRYFEN